MTETIEWIACADGPWNNEPAREEFEHAGLRCIIRRGHMGHLCGYVEAPRGHPLFETPASACECLDVHGGVTWAGTLEPEESGWLIGFDCAHGWDLIPAIEFTYRNAYRDIDYVRREVRSLADQVAAWPGGPKA